MSSVGIDIGNYKCTIGAVVHRQVEILLNDQSNRFTPSMISFTPKCRHVGENAKSQEISNYKNTIKCLKRILGLSYEEIINNESQFALIPVVQIENQVFLQVDYLGKSQYFTPVQLMSILLVGLKETFSISLGSPVIECVLSVPTYYNDSQRRLLMDAATVAGLRPYKLMNESSAIVVEYGIYRANELSEAEPRNVVFVDMGESSLTVTVASFLRGKSEIKSTSWDSNLGGRNFDAILFEHLVQEIQKSHNINVKANQKSTIRLLTSCEKTKKILSANSAANLSVDNLANDFDYSKLIQRDEFESMAIHLLERLEIVLVDSLKNSSLSLDQIHSIELAGGSVRIPMVKNVISKIFKGKTISTTLNFDEAIARGCTLQCAMLSPSLKVREFNIKELNVLPIRCVYDPSEDKPDDRECILFPANSFYPSLKELTFKRQGPFTIQFYSGQNVLLAQFRIEGISCNQKIKARVRLNMNGILNVESFSLIEEKTIEEKDPENETKVLEKKVTTSSEISQNSNPIRWIGGIVNPTGYIGINDSNHLGELSKKEDEMLSIDHLVKETADAKNNLEQIIYEINGKVVQNSGQLFEYSQPGEREELDKLFQELECWLYDEGQDCAKEVYLSKYDQIYSKYKPIFRRYEAKVELDSSVKIFFQSLDEIKRKINFPEYDHLDVEEKEKIISILESNKEKVERLITKETLPLNSSQKQPISSGDIKAIGAEVFKLTSAIFNKPKPQAQQPENVENQPKADAQQQPQEDSSTKSQSEQPSMEVD